MSALTLRSINGSPTVEWRALDGEPVPYMVTIQRRELTPDEREYLDGASEWRTVRVREVQHQLRLDGPVARWLAKRTRVDCSRMDQYADPDGPAYLWNVNA